MIRRAISFLFLLFFAFTSYATHNRAGYIAYQWLGGTTYRVTIITYTKESSVAADRDSLPINWGDGTASSPNIDTLPRVNGGGKGVKLGNDIKYNEYVGIHTFSGFGQYIISMTDPNRIQDIKNIGKGNSVNEPFYIEDTLKIPDPQAFLGYNNSPIISNPPIDFGETNQEFFYNPNAYDPDGDSLTYEFVPPKIGPNNNVSGYQNPNQIDNTTGTPTFTINKLTGEVDWNYPEFCGIYNIAILIKEWRRVKGAPAENVGITLFDMEIIISCDFDRPPKIKEINDTCIVAGSTLKINVTATDPDAGQKVSLSANGGPFLVPSPDTASFVSAVGNPATGQFTWNTICDHISNQVYQVVFRAVDDFSVSPQADLKSWRIKVVAPAPQNLTALASGNSINLKWDDPYKCATASKFLGFSIWRREGCNPFTIDTCITGLAGRGYVKIKDHWQDYTYNDNNVQRGKDYSYRVLADFGQLNNFGQEINFCESLPSNEVCTALKKDIPVITNVSIRTTDNVNGAVYVAWSKPNALELDTVQNAGPYKYFIYHSNDFSGGAFKLIDSIKSSTFYQLIDTTYIDTFVNTIATPWSYKIGFYSNGNFIGETEVASSVFLTIGTASKRLNLSWEEKVPWKNDSYTIFKKNKVTTLWDSIGVTASKSFIDAHLVNDSTYCYYVRSTGSYSAPGFIDPIINLSQRVCAVPIDTVGPCPPNLMVQNDCNTPNFNLGPFVNRLIWNKPPLNCGADLLKYKLYYAATSGEPLHLIDSSHFLNDTTFEHPLSNTIAGCYAVSGVDSLGNEGPKSIPICVDNCPAYELPNVFTPNHDEKNDVFKPIPPFKYIDKVEMSIYDSWGVLVFQTNDPAINWDGKNMNNGKDSPAGTYYYTCYVYENRTEGVVKRSKPLQGFIHLYR